MLKLRHLDNLSRWHNNVIHATSVAINYWKIKSPRTQKIPRLRRTTTLLLLTVIKEVVIKTNKIKYWVSLPEKTLVQSGEANEISSLTLQQLGVMSFLLLKTKMMTIRIWAKSNTMSIIKMFTISTSAQTRSSKPRVNLGNFYSNNWG